MKPTARAIGPLNLCPLCKRLGLDPKKIWVIKQPIRETFSQPPGKEAIGQDLAKEAVEA